MGVLNVGTLVGQLVILEPLTADDANAIAVAAAGDRSSYGHTQVPDGADEAAMYAGHLISEAKNGRVAPFVQQRVTPHGTEIVGCTRFMDPQWPLGRADPDEIEIGGTWLTSSAQRTGVNTEAKLLLLAHAFETWHVQRVAICTDARNLQSRRAIERIGAQLDGILRRHRPSFGGMATNRLRDTAAYSITIDDWPAVQERLRDLTAAVR